MSTERDKYDGQGGSYTVDKKGVRTLKERTRDPNQERPEPKPQKEPQSGEKE